MDASTSCKNLQQFCRICITCTPTSAMQMISIFGEDSLWRKITTLADVKIEKDDTLPQQVCIACAKNAISAYLFKKKCEDADNFFRQQLLIEKTEGNAGAVAGTGVEDVTIHTNDNGNAYHRYVQPESKQQRIICKKCVCSSADDDDNKYYDNNDAEEMKKAERLGNIKKQLENVTESHNPAYNESNDNDYDDDNADDDDEDDDDDDDDEQVEGAVAGDITAIVNEMNDEDGNIVADDGEIKMSNGKHQPPFDFNSIRLMHEYMQQQLSNINNGKANHRSNHHMGNNDDDGAHHQDDGIDADDDYDYDGEPLPLIPEIELLTPADDIIPTTPSIASNALTKNAGGHHSQKQQHICGPSLSPEEVTASSGVMRGYQCPNCYQTFEMKQLLKAHMQSVHGIPGPVYECTNCRKTYFYKRFLEKHIRRGRCVKKRRNQTRPMQCSDCNVLFPTGHHLGWHKRTGCPSRAAKMPLQQLFKQNIVQYNNFPKKIGGRKLENAIYLNNRKLAMTNKRKGRTRIKLDAKKIALAKQLILREATTTVIANELNISRTFAWRLRKSLVNGVSLHERVIDQNVDEQQQQLQQQQQQQLELLVKQYQQQKYASTLSDTEMNEQQQHFQKFELQQQKQQCAHDETVIKEEKLGSDDEHIFETRYEAADSVVFGDDDEQYAKQLNQQKHHHHLVRRGGVDDDGANEDAAVIGNGDDDVNDQNQMMMNNYQQQQQLNQQRQQQYLHIVNAAQMQQQQISVVNDVQSQAAGVPQLISQFPQAVAAAIHQLPVNLSIRSIPLLRNNESHATNVSNHHLHSRKKPRKPNVFINDEKYASAKLLVSQNSSTMEIARALNVSQMTAWKVRDAILKGLPLSYRNKREGRSSSSGSGSVVGPSTSRVEIAAVSDNDGIVMNDGQQQQQLFHEQHQQLQLQQQLMRQQQKMKQQQQQQHQQQLRHLEQQQMDMLKRKQQQQKQQPQEQEQRPQLVIQQQQQQLNILHTNNSSTKHNNNNNNSVVNNTKMMHPRRHLKAAEREQRDKKITSEILELIKEDSNIQYWKVSARLAEKGISISPSSVCQKLKSMGIHRRWKPGDKPPLLDMEQLKAATAAAVAVQAIGAAAGLNNSQSGDESYEQQQFDLSGAHFLSAFTR